MTATDQRAEWRAEANLRGGVPQPTDPDPNLRYFANRIVRLVDALVAVEALHPPHIEQSGKTACPTCLVDYPCPTVRAAQATS